MLFSVDLIHDSSKEIIEMGTIEADDKLAAANLAFAKFQDEHPTDDIDNYYSIDYWDADVKPQ